MKCHYHPALESVSECSVCRKSLCGSCAHTIKGRVYCQDCLVAGAELAEIAASPSMATYSPRRAALFALVPGIGAVYNRQYTKALVHFSVLASLMIMGSEVGFAFTLGAIAFYVFTMIDAYRSAQAILRQRLAHPTAAEEDSERIHAPVWGAVLILFGVLFFLNNLGAVSFRALAKFWPLTLVALGVYLILDYVAAPKRRPDLPGDKEQTHGG